MARFFFRVEYDGCAFSGWQNQKNAHSVQGALEKAFSTVTRKPCAVTGAGRTDAGVHARGQGAHIELPEDTDIYRCLLSVNSVLPFQVAVRDMQPAPESFHARFSATERTYKYYIVCRKTPLLRDRSWMLTGRIDWKRVKENIVYLHGRHDFKTFCASNSGARTTFCTVRDAGLERTGDMLVFTITADRFLYKMARSIVGTLVGIGRGSVKDSLIDIINAKDRKCAGETAPAWGLVLETVAYKEV